MFEVQVTTQADDYTIQSFNNQEYEQYYEYRNMDETKDAVMDDTENIILYPESPTVHIEATESTWSNRKEVQNRKLEDTQSWQKQNAGNTKSGNKNNQSVDDISSSELHRRLDEAGVLDNSKEYEMLSEPIVYNGMMLNALAHIDEEGMVYL